VTCTFTNTKTEGGNNGDTDVCANLDGIQTEVPSGTHLVNDNQCKKNSRRNGSSSGRSNGEVLGATTCGPLLTDYLKLDWANNADEVSKLQQFLNDNIGAVLPVNGFFGPQTFAAVKLFQQNHWEDVLRPWIGLPGSGISGADTPTGYVYQTTRWQINNIWCPGSEEFPKVLN
jgi:hypothetical protein